MLGAAEADPLRPELPGAAGVPRVVGVRPDLEPAELVGPSHEAREPGVGDVRHGGREQSQVDGAERTVDRDRIPLLQDEFTDLRLPVLDIDLERLDSHDGRLAELARDERRVARPPPPARHDTLRGEHPVHIVGLRLGPDHDHVPALLRPRLRGVRVEGHRSDGGPRRDVQSLRDLFGTGAHLLGELRVEVEGHLLGTYAQHGLLVAQEVLVDHVHRDPDLGLRGALPVPGLEQPELPVLDGELEVLHVPVVTLERVGDLDEFAVCVREPLLHDPDVKGGPRPGDHVLPLRVDEEVPGEPRLAGGGIAAHHDPGRRALSHVSEYHRLDVDGRADVVGDA